MYKSRSIYMLFLILLAFQANADEVMTQLKLALLDHTASSNTYDVDFTDIDFTDMNFVDEANIISWQLTDSYNYQAQKTLANLNNQKLDYGSEFGKRYFLDKDISLYAGAGIFIGENFNSVELKCLDNYQQECFITNTAAIYPEFGYLISLGKTNIAFFNRHYIHFYNQRQSRHQMLGFDLSYKF